MKETTMETATDIDPITFAVVKSGLDSIVDEMAHTVVRTARSEIVKDVMDFSAALCAADGQMVAQAKTIALHLGAVPDAIQAVLAKFDGDLGEGDVIIMNDPYVGGMHLPDIFMFMPIFHEGRRCAFAVVICHHTDVGGRAPGSNASDSTEIFQEGLRVPPVKLFIGGRRNDTLFDMIAQNVRVPDRVIGDIGAQVAACKVGERELGRLLDQYGVDKVQRYMTELLDYAERLTLAEIGKWPEGEYSFTDYIDDDGISEEPIPIRTSIRVKGGHLFVDYAGSAPQVRAAINATLSYTKSCTYLGVRCILPGDVPNNAGVFRCITVTAPERSVLNVAHPGACAARALTGYRVVDAVFGALAKVQPERVPAAGEGGNTVVCLSGYRQDGPPFIIVDMICGAWGGRPNQDGVEGITNPSQNLSNTPIEVLEAQHPVRIEEYGYLPDSGGAGKYRGGLGIVREYAVLSDDVFLQLRSDRLKYPPYGLAGGQPGRATRNSLRADGETRILPSKCTLNLRSGAVIRHEQAGGGGYGDPLERDPALIAADVREGKVTIGFAAKEHGVVIDPVACTVDERATSQRRAAIKGVAAGVDA
jgi:N-methylhydantoinase B